MKITITKEDVDNSGYGDDMRAIIRVFADKIKLSLEELKEEIEYILDYEV